MPSSSPESEVLSPESKWDHRRDAEDAEKAEVPGPGFAVPGFFFI